MFLFFSGFDRYFRDTNIDRMKKQLLSHVFFLFFMWLAAALTNKSAAQISPPGLGASNTASWFAFGVRQSLDSSNKIQSFSYVGIGRISGPQSENPFKLQDIFVLNQEFYHKFHKHWQYSLAVSYRNQDEYGEGKSFNAISPAHKQEIRLYGRGMYELKMHNLKFVATYRQEFRSFFDPHFEPEDSRYQLRSRFRLQAALTLDEAKVHRLTASIEALLSTTQSTVPENHWSPFTYKETRLCFYYSIDPENSSFIYSIGYMNDLIGKEDIKSVSYIALDVIWENPFKAFKREVLKPIE
ncbi:hypothetical protein CHU_3615 [Cytophaga hutchinsonii ATCC 33406]|uniref:DUF2490 domain-containing protein n=2 Tax=Cytophaga hutchinsonii TaxID=985 RepID=A0A6N4SWN6_CYTH3|nr:hypothetical protein CHU_3615 [Cytophaga hutchinsonii ATCC 33406]